MGAFFGRAVLFGAALWLLVVVIPECRCFRVVLFDPFVDAFALYGAEFAVAVFVELLEHGLVDLLALGCDGLVGGFLFLDECGFALGSEFFHGFAGGLAFFSVEFAVAVLVEFLTQLFVRPRGALVVAEFFVRVYRALLLGLFVVGFCGAFAVALF